MRRFSLYGDAGLQGGRHAAQQLHLTPPASQSRIAVMEEELSFALLTAVITAYSMTSYGVSFALFYSRCVNSDGAPFQVEASPANVAGGRKLGVFQFRCVLQKARTNFIADCGNCGIYDDVKEWLEPGQVGISFPTCREEPTHKGLRVASLCIVPVGLTRTGKRRDMIPALDERLKVFVQPPMKEMLPSKKYKHRQSSTTSSTRHGGSRSGYFHHAL